MVENITVTKLICVIPVEIGRAARVAIEVARNKHGVKIEAELLDKAPVAFNVAQRRRFNQVHYLAHQVDRILIAARRYIGAHAVR